VTTPVRIQLVDYPPTVQAKAADEIDGAPAQAVWPGMLADYGRTRRAICAAEGWKQPVCRRMRQTRSN
jgi:hypothetical protein